MPELVEVEVARRALEETCVGKKIKNAIVADDSKVIQDLSPESFQNSILGKTILSVMRKGKHMWIIFDSPPFPSFQFGMTGAICIKGAAVTKYKRSAVKDTDDWPSRYSKLFIQLEDGLELSFTDTRRFAKVRLLKDPAYVTPISELGPDALLEPMTIDEFVASLNKKKIAIKPLLLDQSYISGIGNWIADEVLYHAKIHPLQPACSLSRESCSALHNCIKEVIETAIKVGADSSMYPSNWIFHSREKKPGKAFIDGKKIEFITAGGRTCAYVPELQILSGTQVTKLTVGSKKRTFDGGDKGDDGSVETVRNARSGRKKPPSKGKFKDSDDSEDKDQKKTGKRKKAPAKRMLKDVDDG